MLVQYTPLADLSPNEIAALRAAITGLTLEGRGSHFQFAGKTFKTAELIAAQRVWEQSRRLGGQLLQERSNQHSL